jgi:hypothetical protein
MTPPARPDRRIRPAADEGLIGRVAVLSRRRDGQRRPSIEAGLASGEGAVVIFRWSVVQGRNAPSEAVPVGGRRGAAKYFRALASP